MGRHGENIHKRKDGRWEARYITGYDLNGKARYKYLYGKTYYEARELKNQLESQQSIHNSSAINHPKNNTAKDTGKDIRMTFGELLNDWLISIKPDVKESTYAKYVFLAEKHILPELGNIPLTHLNTETIETFTSMKLANGRLKGHGGLSPKTVSSLLSIIKLALRFGSERKYFCSNNVIVKNPKQNKPDIMILSLKEQQKLEEYLFQNPNKIHTGIILSLYAGLRIGEVCALQWGDFNFDNNTVTVQRTITRIQDVSPEAEKKTKVVIDRPKTECSYRTIPLPSFLIRYIKNESRIKSFYILTGSETYMEPRYYYLKYKKIMEACDLAPFTYHALRHTFATRCIENNFDLKSLSEILGHANVTTTMQRYVHPSMSLKRQHMDRLENIASHSQTHEPCECNDTM